MSFDGYGATLTYDPNGRLFEVNTMGNKQQFLWDGDALVAEYNGLGNMATRWVHGDQVDEPWVQFPGSSTALSDARFLHTNHQGSVIAYSDQNGNVTTTQAYSPFGIPANESLVQHEMSLNPIPVSTKK